MEILRESAYIQGPGPEPRALDPGPVFKAKSPESKWRIPCKQALNQGLFPRPRALGQALPGQAWAQAIWANPARASSEQAWACSE